MRKFFSNFVFLRNSELYVRNKYPIGIQRTFAIIQHFFSFSNRNDSDSDCDELSDGEISKLLIVTQTPNRPRKHEGFDRTGDFCSRVKLSQDLAQVINDGLSYYEVIIILILNKLV